MTTKLNGCIFWLKMMTCWKNIIRLGIKSALILKKNLIANLSTIFFFFLKTKIKCYDDEATYFYKKEMSKVGSNHTCLVVITTDFVFLKRWKLLSAGVLERMKTQRKKVIRYVTDDLEIYSDDSDEEWVKTKYPVKYFLTKMC